MYCFCCHFPGKPFHGISITALCGVYTSARWTEAMFSLLFVCLSVCLWSDTITCTSVFPRWKWTAFSNSVGSIYSKKCLDGQQINYRLENIKMSRISYSTPVMINLVLGHIFEMVVNSMSVQSFLRVNRPHRVWKCTPFPPRTSRSTRNRTWPYPNLTNSWN